MGAERGQSGPRLHRGTLTEGASPLQTPQIAGSIAAADRSEMSADSNTACDASQSSVCHCVHFSPLRHSAAAPHPVGAA